MTSIQAPYLQAHRFTNDKHTDSLLINKLHIRGVWRYVCTHLVLKWTNERDDAQNCIMYTRTRDVRRTNGKCVKYEVGTLAGLGADGAIIYLHMQTRYTATPPLPLPIQHHLHLKTTKVYEQKFPVIQHFRFTATLNIRPQTAINKQWRYIVTPL